MTVIIIRSCWSWLSITTRVMLSNWLNSYRHLYPFWGSNGQHTTKQLCEESVVVTTEMKMVGTEIQEYLNKKSYTKVTRGLWTYSTTEPMTLIDFKFSICMGQRQFLMASCSYLQWSVKPVGCSLSQCIMEDVLEDKRILHLMLRYWTSTICMQSLENNNNIELHCGCNR